MSGRYIRVPVTDAWTFRHVIKTTTDDWCEACEQTLPAGRTDVYIGSFPTTGGYAYCADCIEGGETFL